MTKKFKPKRITDPDEIRRILMHELIEQLKKLDDENQKPQREIVNRIMLSLFMPNIDQIGVSLFRPIDEIKQCPKCKKWCVINKHKCEENV